ncbi:MAG: alginate O-acetyltransferase AlgX-related protein [Aeromonas sp.]
MSKVGFLESFNREVISGWVAHNSMDTESEELKLYINDKFHSIITANIKRSDILNVGFGFSLETNILNQDKNFKISIRNSQGSDIDNSPAIILVEKESYDKVLFGKNGWLFLCNDTNNTIEQSTGKFVVKDFVVDKWKKIIEDRISICNELGVEYYNIIAPSKETVYPEYLPSGLTISNDRPVNRITKKLNKIAADNRLIYPDYSLIINKENAYHKGDTHWTYYGAYIAYLELMCKINQDLNIIDYTELTVSQFYQASDLISKTTTVNVEVVEIPIINNSLLSKTYCNGVNNTGREERYLNESGKGKVLIYHSSSIDWMKPFIINTFHECVFMWSHNIDYSIVQAEAPDFLITQTNERFLSKVPSDYGLIRSAN